MSGQWEVVGKKKDKPIPKLSQQSTKKKVENLNVKVNDVLAKSQVISLYSNIKNKENKPIETKPSPEHKTKTKKKPEKQSPKVKPPKSIESALKQITPSEFRNIFDTSKSHFPEAPIVWLKDLAHFINQRVNVDIQDPIFTQKPQNYPLSALPSDLKAVIDDAVKEAKKANIQVFFDIALTAMATDMNKNLPTVGYKIFLQYIALEEPTLVIANLSKQCMLRTSYQNQPDIGLSILWAVGHVGFNNFDAGFKTFQELMLPLIELKNYSKFIYKYLIDLMRNNNGGITQNQFLLILDVVFSTRKNYPNDLKQNLIDVLPNLKMTFFDNKKETKNSVEIYFKKIPKNPSNTYQDCLSSVIVDCFSKDSSCIEHWTKIYIKNITASAIFLKYVDKHWTDVCTKINGKLFAEALRQIITINKEILVKKKKDQTLTDFIKIAEKLLNVTTQKRKSFSFLKLIILLMVLSSGFFIYSDVKNQGWEKSNFNRLIEKSGLYEGVSWIDGQVQDKFPNYRQSVIVYTEPYIELIGNLTRVFYNIFNRIVENAKEEYPKLVQVVDSYAPGVVEKSQNFITSVWSSIIFYYNSGLVYLQTKVFIGQLSPENLKKFMIEALNVTQTKVSEYYLWASEKLFN